MIQDIFRKTVLDAYGWQHIQPICGFFPEFDEDDDEDENGRPKRKKYRYRWTDSVHDDLLILLLDLNRKRADEEKSEFEELPVKWGDGETMPAQSRRSRGKNGAKNDTIAEKPTLFNAEEQEV